MVLATHPLPMSCVVQCRVLGMIQTADQDGQDMKLICVPTDKIDPRWSHIKSIEDLNPHTHEDSFLKVLRPPSP